MAFYIDITNSNAPEMPLSNINFISLAHVMSIKIIIQDIIEQELYDKSMREKKVHKT